MVLSIAEVIGKPEVNAVNTIMGLSDVNHGRDCLTL